MKRLVLLVVAFMIIASSVFAAGPAIFVSDTSIVVSKGDRIYIFNNDDTGGGFVSFEVTIIFGFNNRSKIPANIIVWNTPLTATWNVVANYEKGGLLKVGGISTSGAPIRDTGNLFSFSVDKFEGDLEISFQPCFLNERSVPVAGPTIVKIVGPLRIVDGSGQTPSPTIVVGDELILGVLGGQPPYTTEVSLGYSGNVYSYAWPSSPLIPNGTTWKFNTLMSGWIESCPSQYINFKITDIDGAGNRAEMVFTFLPKIGDPNGDGLIDAKDALWVLNGVIFMKNLSGGAIRLAADVSGNGTVSTYDAALILQRCAGIIQGFNAGYGAPSKNLKKEKEDFGKVFLSLVGKIDGAILKDLKLAYAKEVTGRAPVTWGKIKMEL